ncbi:MAG: hypothetical protein ACTSUE_00850 [Promethearchaeota archaeon]
MRVRADDRQGFSGPSGGQVGTTGSSTTMMAYSKKFKNWLKRATGDKLISRFGDILHNH